MRLDAWQLSSRSGRYPLTPVMACLLLTLLCRGVGTNEGRITPSIAGSGGGRGGEREGGRLLRAG